MHLTLTDAAIGSGLAAPVPPLTLSAGPGTPTVLAVETAERPMLVSLLIGGRVHADSGSVQPDADTLRRRTALVDTPVVAEPHPAARLAAVIAEEFVFASRRASARTVRDFLARHGLADYAKVPVRALRPADRVRLFCEVALLRDDVEALVLTSPERHGGDPAAWYFALAAIAARGITVVIVTDAPTAGILVGLGARDASAAPLELEV